MAYDPYNPNYRQGPVVPGSPGYMPRGSGIGAGLPPVPGASGYSSLPGMSAPYMTPDRFSPMPGGSFARPMGFNSEQPVFPDFGKAPGMGGGEGGGSGVGKVLGKIGGAITNPQNLPMWALLLGTGLQAYGSHQEGKFREKQAAEEKRRYEDRRKRAKTYTEELEEQLRRLRAQPVPQHSSPYLD